jgi:hypothetical protein
MVMIWTLLGALFVALGTALWHRSKKIWGSLFGVLGGLLLILGAAAWLSFHP